jgi:YVTN family beta-propeller protein
VTIALGAFLLVALQMPLPAQQQGVVTTNQKVTPAGAQSVFDGRVHNVSFGARSSEVWAIAAPIDAPAAYRLSLQSEPGLQRVKLDGTLGPQSSAFDHVTNRLLIAVTVGGKVQLMAVGDSAEIVTKDIGRTIAGAMAVAAAKNAKGQRVAAVPLTLDNQLAVVDVETGALLFKSPAGIAPFGVALNRSGTVAYVSNWGGRKPLPGEPTGPTGHAADADQVVVDSRGIAATGTVTRIDLQTNQVTYTIAVGLHPTALAWDTERQRLYVTNGNSESVSVIDTKTNRVVQTIDIQPFSRRVVGISPTAVAVAPDGSRLFVTCGGINAVAVIQLPSGRLLGMVPTSWYPSSLALSGDGKRLAVGTLLGQGWTQEERELMIGNPAKPMSRRWNLTRGAVAVVDVPDDAQLASYTTVVAQNNRMTLASSAARSSEMVRKNIPAAAVPRRAGEPSLIDHVVYIVKENHTYDTFFGDMKKGNGDASMHMYGDSIIPNHRRLADQFVLLDNFYSTGGNSGDGHQWVTQANETDYPMWPGYAGRSYPYEGSDPIAYSRGGFIWDAAAKMGKTVKIFGEFVPNRVEPNRPRDARARAFDEYRQGVDFTNRYHVTPDIKRLNDFIAPNYPTFSGPAPDVVRAQIFLRYLKQWESAHKMPNLVIIQLPSDHGMGGGTTYIADIADNDMALGQIVEGLTKSSFWKTMAIFAVEDDPGGGIDHVDGHRTVALAMSPYIKRGSVDSTMYSHPSIPKTIELMLGLPTMSLFDLIANDMRASFQDRPDYTPYVAATPKHPIDERAPKLSQLTGKARLAALEYSQMDFSHPDAAPAEKVSQIAWHMMKGWDTPYPAVRHSVFSLGIDLADDEQEERARARRNKR